MKENDEINTVNTITAICSNCHNEVTVDFCLDKHELPTCPKCGKTLVPCPLCIVGTDTSYKGLCPDCSYRDKSWRPFGNKARFTENEIMGIEGDDTYQLISKDSGEIIEVFFSRKDLIRHLGDLAYDLYLTLQKDEVRPQIPLDDIFEEANSWFNLSYKTKDNLKENN